MAIYHLSAKIHSRKSGKSIVAAAAYRAGQSLFEDRTGIAHDYTRKQGVEHSEILAPEVAPNWVHDRLALWNAIEAIETRKDSQLAREVEVGLPVELNDQQQLELLREFVKREFVSRGMLADFSIHRDDANNPHAHILLSTRSLSKEGFGLKERTWNEREHLLQWREGWEEVSNEHLARAGLAVRIDHRSLKAQGLDLEPGRKIGVSRERQMGADLPDRIADRVIEQREIARENGQRIIEDPGVALKALTHSQATFSRQDIARFLHTRTEGAEQFQAALLKVTTSRELVALGRDDRNVERYTSREMLQTEAGLLDRSKRMTQRFGHGVEKSRQASVLSQHQLSEEQTGAFQHLVGGGDLKVLVGVAGSGKSRLLGAAREAWEAQGFTVKGAALSGIAAENLCVASGIQSRTLASFEYSWQADRDPLTSRDVLVIDETGMVGTRQLARVLEVANTARAKVVLVGDPEQLQAIEAGAPFRAVLAESGVAQLSEVRRQRHAWQREATQQLAAGETVTALTRYEKQGAVVQVVTHESARNALLARWAKERQLEPDATRLMLAYTREDVRELNGLARTLRQQRGELGHAEKISTERGVREFAVNERLYFLRNEKSLGVRNGSLGTVEAIEENIVQVKLDGREGRVAVDTRFYRDLDYGYAATVYKAQGSTVDRTYLLATPHFDRHATYVALSRHRVAATVFYAAEDFGAQPGWEINRERVREQFMSTLSRARPKEMVHDYLDRENASVPAQDPPAPKPGADDKRRQGIEAWRAMRSKSRSEELSADQQRQRAAQAWLKLRQEKAYPDGTMDDIEERQRQAERWRAQRTRELENPQAIDKNLFADPSDSASRERHRDHSRAGQEDDAGL
jgi:Ti-type conjugative transfer relaxase TraA